MAEPGQGAGWAEHERSQRQAWLRLTPRQRLDWLWQAKEFARRAGEARRGRAGGGTSTPDAAKDGPR
jgi:hypothetical protein